MVNDLIESDDFLKLVDTKLDLPYKSTPFINEYHNYDKKIVVNNRSRVDDDDFGTQTDFVRTMK